MTQPTRALELIAGGTATARDIALAMGVSRVCASVVLHRLLRRGAIVARGVERTHGRPRVVWGAVGRE